MEKMLVLEAEQLYPVQSSNGKEKNEGVILDTKIGCKLVKGYEECKCYL